MSRPSIVFCHGIWADGSCFGKLIGPLQAAGYQVIAAQYALDDVEDDVAAVQRTLGRVSSPALLVGHSYGGTVITAAGADARVAGLVYIAALAPDRNETSASQQEQFPVTEIFSHTEIADGRIWMQPDGVGYFAGDLTATEQKLVWATQSAPAATLFTKAATGTAWRTKPTWYVIASEDRTVRPELERFAATRMGATAREIAASHLPMLSHPREVLEIIRSAAEAVS